MCSQCGWIAADTLYRVIITHIKTNVIEEKLLCRHCYAYKKFVHITSYLVKDIETIFIGYAR
jgi:hypothetical protein